TLCAAPCARHPVRGTLCAVCEIYGLVIHFSLSGFDVKHQVLLRKSEKSQFYSAHIITEI
ncbi:MAG: hypothetical protein WCI88_16105, partial [Chloroflexota bacterium]